MDARDLLPVGEIAERSGFAASALRFYEAEGLIHAERSPGGRRLFERSTLRRLAFIRAAANVGLTLQEIRDELGRLPERRTPTRADWTRISRHWRGRLDEQIAALERLRDDLDGCIGCGCLSLQACRLLNRDDRAASYGAGPRWVLGDPDDAAEGARSGPVPIAPRGFRR
jgi:MerR family transcriptional regulator, redox-sensitive transcriptional activator SoxR